MFEDDDDAPLDDDAEMDKLFAGVSLCFLVAICLALWFYYMVTVGVYGPPL